MELLQLTTVQYSVSCYHRVDNGAKNYLHTNSDQSFNTIIPVLSKWVASNENNYYPIKVPLYLSRYTQGSFGQP